MEKKGKHVIFLGAGASVSSGYPVGEQLALLITSKEHRTKLCNNHGYHDLPPEGNDFIASAAKEIEVFRSGCFNSIDEFCKLSMGTDSARHIPKLKQLMRVALSINDPERNFADSEYRRLVNRLFQPDGFSLRDDLSILTFNYDAYLEYLLFEAVQRRHQIVSGKFPRAELLDSITSGFWTHGSKAWAGLLGFCVLKLHGSLAYPYFLSNPSLTMQHPYNAKKKLVSYDDLFGLSLTDRIACLVQDETPVPCVFPWEIIQAGSFIPEADFCHTFKPPGASTCQRTRLCSPRRSQLSPVPKCS